MHSKRMFVILAEDRLGKGADDKANHHAGKILRRCPDDLSRSKSCLFRIPVPHSVSGLDSNLTRVSLSERPLGKVMKKSST